ncbi:hypothetical protein [Photobacterium sp. 1_MG-2023]|uniref:hypothetical protein n=1 Tax=Photobacterium sp. 1_MG-2023 TaxID=3062646 RepID=UPI0026E1922F|nr:hypothetical protein [Photobacterium sp. 1_MG-2023]MDO6707168.1 hypothetical protein [Photobacterium sp. 1_MG-2023]
MLGSLIVSVMPGAYRIYLLWMVSFFLGNSEATGLSVYYTLTTSLLMVTSLGYCLITLKDLSGVSFQDGFKYYYKSITGILVLSFSIWGGYSLYNDVFNLEKLYLIVFLGIYQLERHYWLKDKRFFNLALIDLLLVLLTTLLFGFSNNLNPYIIISLSHIASIFVSFICRKLNDNNTDNLSGVSANESPNHFESIRVGCSNMISSGVFYFIPSAVLLFDAESFVQLIALTVTLSGVAIVFPRAVLNSYIPKVSKEVKLGKFDNCLREEINKKIRVLCVLLYVPVIIACIIYLYVSGVALNSQSIILVGLICATVTIGQLYLLDSYILLFMDMDKKVLLANIMVLAAISLMSYIIYLMDIMIFNKVLLLWCGIIVLYLARWFYYSYIIRDKLV